MTVAQQIITIALCSLATIICRFAPFLAFSLSRETPRYIRYIGNACRALPSECLCNWCFSSSAQMSIDIRLRRSIYASHSICSLNSICALRKNGWRILYRSPERGYIEFEQRENISSRGNEAYRQKRAVWLFFSYIACC